MLNLDTINSLEVQIYNAFVQNYYASDASFRIIPGYKMSMFERLNSFPLNSTIELRWRRKFFMVMRIAQASPIGPGAGAENPDAQNSFRPSIAGRPNAIEDTKPWPRLLFSPDPFPIRRLRPEWKAPLIQPPCQGTFSSNALHDR